MSKPLLLKISIANSKSQEYNDSYDLIENGLKGAECYRLDKTKVTFAAIEFVAILTAAGAIATIANFLYNVWKENRNKADLYVGIDPDNNIQMIISGETTEVQIEDFQRKINLVQRSGSVPRMDQELLDEIKRKGIWIRAK